MIRRRRKLDEDPGSSVKEKRRKLNEEHDDGDPGSSVKGKRKVTECENPQEEDPEPRKRKRKMKEDEDDAVEEVPRHADGAEIVLKKKKKKKGMVCDRRIVKPRGCACPLCYKKESQEDEIDPTRSMMWGYSPKRDADEVWRNQGSLCYYCYRVFMAKYNVQHTVKTLITTLGADGKQLTEFSGYREICVTQLKDSPQRWDTAVCSWQKTGGESLWSEQKGEMAMKTHTGDLWNIEDYTKRYGNIETNGLGHELRSVKNKTGVFIPAPRFIRIEENEMESIKKVHCEDDGELVLAPDQVGAKYNMIVADLSGISGVGVTLDDLLAPLPALLDARSSTEPSAKALADVDDIDDDEAGGRRRFGLQAETVVTTVGGAKDDPGKASTTPTVKFAMHSCLKTIVYRL